MIEKKRLYIGIGLGIVIIVLSTIMFIGGHDIFKSKLELKYPDGCIERYDGGLLITPICTNGRILDEANNNRNKIPIPPVANINITFPTQWLTQD